MAVTMPSNKQKGKNYISTKRKHLDPNDPSLKETSVSYNDDMHGIHGKETEHFSKLKKRLQKKTI